MTERLIKNIIAEELFGNHICESLKQHQTVDYIFHQLINEKLLFGEPVSVPELRDLLRKKVLNFQFIKLDGEVRPAKGTTMQKYIPQEDRPKGIKPSSEKVAVFYDLSKDAWRSVSAKSKEITIERDPETKKPIVKVSDKKPKEEPEEKPIATPGPEPTPAPSAVEPTPAPEPAEEPEEITPETTPESEPESEPLDVADETKPADEVKPADVTAAPEPPQQTPTAETGKSPESEFEFKPIDDIEYTAEDKEKTKKEIK